MLFGNRSVRNSKVSYLSKICVSLRSSIKETPFFLIKGYRDWEHDKPIIFDTSDFVVSGNNLKIRAAYSALLLLAYWLILWPVYILNQSLRLLSDRPDNFARDLRDVESSKHSLSTPSKAAASSILRSTAFSFFSISVGIGVIVQR